MVVTKGISPLHGAGHAVGKLGFLAGAEGVSANFGAQIPVLIVEREFMMPEFGRMVDGRKNCIRLRNIPPTRQHLRNQLDVALHSILQWRPLSL